MSQDTFDQENDRPPSPAPTVHSLPEFMKSAPDSSWAIKRSLDLLEESRRILAESRSTIPPRR